MAHKRDFAQKMEQLTAEVLSSEENRTIMPVSESQEDEILMLKAELAVVRKQMEQLSQANDQLTLQLSVAEDQIRTLKEKTKHNARNAGRKKRGGTDSYRKFAQMMERGIKRDEIMLRMNISRRSYYNYLKEWNIQSAFESAKKR